MVGEALAGRSAIAGDDPLLTEETGVGFVGGRMTGDGTDEVVRVCAGGAGDEVGVTAGAGFWELCCPKTKADTGTKAGRWDEKR